MTTTSCAVNGLTCGYCTAEVMEQVRELVGVTGVAVDLVTNGSAPVVVPPVLFYAGWPIHRAGWLALSHRTAGMNSLITLAPSRPTGTASW